MKKLQLLITSAILAISANATDIEKKGFLTTKWCAENGYFADCRLETLVCKTGDCYKTFDIGNEKAQKEELVLFVHNDGIYNIDSSTMDRTVFDAGMNRNEITIVGTLNSETKTIVAKEFKAPPPPSKSFFKGCL